jgi:hypothetical protein
MVEPIGAGTSAGLTHVEHNVPAPQLPAGGPNPVAAPADTYERVKTDGVVPTAPFSQTPAPREVDPRFNVTGDQIVVGARNAGSDNDANAYRPGDSVGGPDGPVSAEHSARVRAYVDQHGSAIGEDGKRRQLSPDEVGKISAALERFPPWAVDKLEGGDVKIEVRPNSRWPDDHERAGALYYGKDNKVLFRQETLDAPDGRDRIYGQALHEFGHALDDTLKADGVVHAFTNFGSGGVRWSSDDSQFQQIFHDYQDRARDPNNAVYTYGGGKFPNAREYFAAGVQYYLANSASRTNLSYVDPALFAYMQNLFG